MDDHITALCENIQSCGPLSVLKGICNVIGINNKQTVTQWIGADSLNCMHHAILAGNTEAVMFFHLNGYFTAPHRPKCNDYLHLACYTGHTAIAGFLIEESQFIGLPMGYLCYPDVCVSSKVASSSLDCKHHERTACMLSPLDAAAKGDQLRCVQLLLLSKYIRSKTTSLIERACIVGSSAGLELLLRKHPETSLHEKRKAVEEAIKRRQTECLEILFQHGADAQGLFHGAHPLTVLFSASDGYLPFSQRNEHLLEVTRVLLHNGVTCNATVVTDYTTSPIATLVYQAMLKVWQFDEYSEEHFRCLELILAYKSDFDSPEFCEIMKNMFGYCPPEHFPLYSETVIQYMTLLLKNHAHKQLVVENFHLLLGLMTKVFGPTGDTNVTECVVNFFQSLILLFMKHGADPDLGLKTQFEKEEALSLLTDEMRLGKAMPKTVTGKTEHGYDTGVSNCSQKLWFPVNEYVASIFNHLRISLTRYTDDPKSVHIILNLILKPVALLAVFMKRIHFRAAQKAPENPIQSILKVRHEIYPQMIGIAGDEVGDEESCDLQGQACLLQIVPARSQSLLHACRLTIWNALGRKFSAIDNLPIAPGLKSCLKQMFDFQGMHCATSDVLASKVIGTDM